ncbi:response regulator [Bacillus sp. EB106-08-02-XG196]|uniref:response regulator n=1 Tax=Bacillus sp. EB106-08-02-XG196 TaxID=2737049 RepID=UPI0015C4C63F|nr:response regulator [Bacillus sp. EB106-08-02-XG196]NWQ44411.1 response regulator [Bacillus sp. EB106-08-02-XG196]
MKIKTKLLLGLSAKPLIIILLIITGLVEINSLAKLNETTQKNYQLSLLAERLHTDVKNEAISLRNIVIFSDNEQIQKELAALQEIQHSINGNIVAMETKVNSDKQKILVGKLKATNEKFNDYTSNVTLLLSQGKKEEAVTLIKNSSATIHNEFLNIVTDMGYQFETNMVSTFSEVTKDFKQQIWASSLISLISVILVTAFVFHTVWTFALRLSKVSGLMTNIAEGSDLSKKIEVKGTDEIDDIAQSFNRMTETLEKQMAKEQNILWVKSNSAEIITSISGTHNLESLSRTFLSKVVPLLDSSHAVMYVKDSGNQIGEPVFKLLASYASIEGENHPKTISPGEGLIGQAIQEKRTIVLSDVPSDYIKVSSGLGEAEPRNIYLIPAIFEGDVKAVLEFASFKSFSSNHHALLAEIIDSLGIILDSVFGRIQLAQVLEETQVLMEEIQAQSEELQSQQEELRVTNEELEEQTQALRNSEEILQTQQEELEETNAELLEKAKILEEQNKKFELTNREVENAREKLEEKAKQLALNSKYKSEFLANMSHELRTPLNSLLILSKLLADNQTGNLSEKQIKYADTIYSSGSDLLTLINDILDLAKIESGKMEVNSSKVFLTDLVDFAESRFRAIANEKNLRFTISLEKDLPPYIYNDEQRLQQVLKNLLSNAFKFTHQGDVRLEIRREFESDIAFSVIDTGIGIPKEKQELIFKAFQQADGTTSRKYGGTGLGLSISREIADLINGDITVTSEENKGSKFTFFVRDFGIEENRDLQKRNTPFEEAAVSRETVEDEEEIIPHHSQVLEQKQVIEPIRNIMRLLIVDDDLRHRTSLMELIGEKDVIIKAVSSASEAFDVLKVNHFDCMILDLGLGETPGFELLEKIKMNEKYENLHVFIYTGRNLTKKEENFLKRYVHTIIIKDTYSPQRLKDELDLLINSRNEQGLINEELEPNIYSSNTELEGKRILLVDDDVRNVYALMSFLEQYNMDISFAENGRESLEVLEKESNFDLILMDIMMPEMDGYEAIKRIRAFSHFNNLPIIALTAKAMKEDREKCLEAGASDYIVKPFDPDQLISLIRVWLYQKNEK